MLYTYDECKCYAMNITIKKKKLNGQQKAAVKFSK